MGKVLKIGLAVAGIAVAFIPGVGPALTGAIYGLTGGAVGAGAAAVLAVGQAITAGLGAIGIATAFGLASKALGLGPKSPNVNRSTADRLRATIDPTTPRKHVFGETALATDIRYQSYTGSNQEYYHQIVCVASHKVDAITEIWLEDKTAWTLAGGVQGEYSGYLTVTPVLEGSSANVVEIDSKWGSATGRRLTGCAYVHLRYKLTGNTKKTESPFATNVPSRMTIKGRARLFYDPRRDSTVPGGAGSMRVNDQSTWAFTVGGVAIGRNAALAELNWLLGWKIGGKLAVGRGVPVNRIQLASFMTAANLCEEAVLKADGSSEPRYRFDGITDESQDGSSDIALFGSAMNGVLRDAGGQLALTVLHNDLAAPVAHFTTDDVIGPYDWTQTQSLTAYRNIVRGKYVDASNNSLFQLVDYPQVALTAPDGIDRIEPFDLPGVQSPSQAQRLAKQRLQRLQYGGTFSAPFNARGWIVQPGDPVTFDFYPCGFLTKNFRVVERTMRFDGVCDLVLREEHPDIYAWDASEAAAVNPAAPTVYDWQNNPLIAQLATIQDGATRNVDRGPWASGTTYAAGDEVQDQGSTWGAKIDHTATGANGPPTLPTTENATWRLRAKIGDAGAAQSIVELTIFKRSGSGAPALPSGGSYDFATKTLTPPSGWSSGAIPAGSDPAYAARGYAAVTGLTGTVTPAWLAVGGPVFVNGSNGADGDDGTDGVDGVGADLIFKRSATQPSTPSPSSGVPSGWYGDTNSVPAGADPIWTSPGTRPDSTSNWTWQTPKRVEGLDGADGADGFTLSGGGTASIACTAAGTPKTDELPRSFAMKVVQGATDLSDDGATTYAIASSSGGTASLGGTNGKVLTITSMSADTATFTVNILRSGTVIGSQEVKLSKARDGAAVNANKDDTLAAMPSLGGSGAQIGSFTIIVPNGATLRVSANVSYFGNGAGSNSYGGQIRGSWTVDGSETFGGWYSGDIVANDGEQAIATFDDDPTYTNSSGVTKEATVRLYGRRSVGTSGSSLTNGYVEGTVG